VPSFRVTAPAAWVCLAGPPPSFAKSAQDDVIPDYSDGIIWSCALARHNTGQEASLPASALGLEHAGQLVLSETSGTGMGLLQSPAWRFLPAAKMLLATAP